MDEGLLLVLRSYYNDNVKPYWEAETDRAKRNFLKTFSDYINYNVRDLTISKGLTTNKIGSEILKYSRLIENDLKNNFHAHEKENKKFKLKVNELEKLLGGETPKYHQAS